MTTVAGVVMFKAKPGLGGEATQRISAALPAVEKEQGTTLWRALRSNADADMIFLVDLFDGKVSLDAHMTGDAAKLIFATAPDLLVTNAELHPCIIVAAKPQE